ncbi:MAG: SgcJ/EcaC family oxidoreductase [Cyclobacteriaceae bacterium]|nr:SgcJ/EcaC family oxidoreductase [Cyclobacteriaceae bacterium]
MYTTHEHCKRSYALLTLSAILTLACSQNETTPEQTKDEIKLLITQYSKAREKQDMVLLKNILTTDIDQLVSSGEWRTGVEESIAGMRQSSGNNPGTRKLMVEKVRFLNPDNAIVDARYEIEGTDGTTQKMWSTFIVVQQEGQWKIAAIRNMLPTGLQN